MTHKDHREDHGKGGGLFGLILGNSKVISKDLETSFCSLVTVTLCGLKGVLLSELCYRSFDTTRSERYSFAVDARIVPHQKKKGCGKESSCSSMTKATMLFFRAAAQFPRR